MGAGATAEDLNFCQYLDARIQKLADTKKLLRGVDSEVKGKIEASKICDIASKLAAECAANQQGDECAAEKMDNLLKLREARKNSPSGRLIFYHCEQMNYEKVMKLFTTMRAMMSAECGLPAQQGTRNRRNTDLLLPLLLGGAYDPTSIWYQYFLSRRKTFTATSSPRVGPRQITDNIICMITFLTTQLVFSQVLQI